MGVIVNFLLGIVFLFSSMISTTAVAADGLNQSKFQNLTAAGVNPQALRIALKGYSWAQAKGEVQKHILTLVDFTKPSTAKRLWVINLDTGTVIYNGLVAHGSGSGQLYATHFSDRPGSRESSLGAMVTGSTYDGKHGVEVRIQGLEPGLNNTVANRAVIFHSAPYATSAFAEEHGYLGRSWGCFAIDPKAAHYVFNTIKGGSFVFAYAPQENHDPNFISS